MQALLIIAALLLSGCSARAFMDGYNEHRQQRLGYEQAHPICTTSGTVQRNDPDSGLPDTYQGSVQCD